MTKYEARKQYLEARRQADAATKLLSDAVNAAIEALSTWFNVTGTDRLELSREVSFLGEGCDYHGTIVAVGRNDHGELELYDDIDEPSRFDDRSIDVQLEILSALGKLP
jgi:hypothetical protein